MQRIVFFFPRCAALDKTKEKKSSKRALGRGIEVASAQSSERHERAPGPSNPVGERPAVRHVARVEGAGGDEQRGQERDDGARDGPRRLEEPDLDQRERSVFREVGVRPYLLLQRGAIASVAVGDLLGAALLDDVDAEPVCVFFLGGGRGTGKEKEREKKMRVEVETQSFFFFDM